MAAAHPFVLERPESIDEALAHLFEHGDEARILAGGQSLTPLLTLGLSAPAVIISLDRCEGLSTFDLHELSPGHSRLTVGSMVTTSWLCDQVERLADFEVLTTAANGVGSPHVRNFGTVVGNVCHADPGSDLIPALLCYETTVELRSASASRLVELDRFVTGPFTTSIADDELALAIHAETDATGGWQSGYRKLVKRAGDLAVAACAVRLRLEADRIVAARVSLGGAVSKARRLGSVETALAGAAAHDAGQRALTADWRVDVLADLLPDAATPLAYLEQMLPRFIAATVDDAATGTKQ